jgi:uncharacterized protein (TIGR00288 family)
MSIMSEKDDIAIFWDYENVKVIAQGLKVPLAEAIMEFAQSVGHPRIKKVYANWSNISTAISQALYSIGFDPIHVSMGKANSVDVKLAVDCLDIAFTFPNITHFLIVTGDKDFIPVVNWLKAQRKKTIIIGKSDLVSEHLIESADDFISLEELAEMEEKKQYSITPDAIPQESISFEDAVKCLIEVISANRAVGNSSRFLTVDNLMRSNSRYKYRGAKSVRLPEGSGVFSTFTKFIDRVEKEKKIKSEIVEGFRELFLIEEDPKLESQFSNEPSREIDPKDWPVIFDLVQKCFKEGNEKFKTDWLSFLYISSGIRLGKKNGTLPYSNRIILKALQILPEIGALKQNDEGNFVMSAEFKENPTQFVDLAMKKYAN